jgi:predicted nucleotidyltransferase
MVAEMNSHTVTQVLTEQLPQVIAIYQFGSRVRGEARPTSDIDLAVLARHPIPAERLFEIAQDLAIRLHRDVDLLDLRTLSTVMRMQVLSIGQCLYTRDDQAKAEFEMYAYADYARLNEERRDLIKGITQRGLVYG